MVRGRRSQSCLADLNWSGSGDVADIDGGSGSPSNRARRTTDDLGHPVGAGLPASLQSVGWSFTSPGYLTAPGAQGFRRPSAHGERKPCRPANQPWPRPQTVKRCHLLRTPHHRPAFIIMPELVSCTGSPSCGFQAHLETRTSHSALPHLPHRNIGLAVVSCQPAPGTAPHNRLWSWTDQQHGIWPASSVDVARRRFRTVGQAGIWSSGSVQRQGFISHLHCARDGR